jgi:hypothetical protein
VRSLREHLLPLGREGWYEHPLELPTILLNIHSRHTQWEINQIADDVEIFEDVTKTVKYRQIDQFNEITTQLACLERALDFENNLV